MKHYTYKLTNSISWSNLDSYVYEVQRRLWAYGADGRDAAPLQWYIGTGRASTEFLHALVLTKPYLVARRLKEGGTYDEAIARVKALLKV